MLDYRDIIKEKERRNKKRRLFLIVAILILVVGGSVSAVLIRSSFFQIQGIILEQASSTSVTNLAEAARQALNQKNWWQKLVFNDNNIILAKLNRAAAQNILITKYPALKELNISVDVMSKGISLALLERERYGLWCSQSPDASEPHACWWFDSEGIVFLEGPIAHGELIKKIIDLDDVPIKAGDRALLLEHAQNLASIYRVLELSGIGTKTLARKNHEFEEVHTISERHPMIIFSLREDASFALEPLLKLKAQFADLTYINLTVKNRVYYQ